jgi:formylglycine-generating enzyme required for sulfatase activity
MISSQPSAPTSTFLALFLCLLSACGGPKYSPPSLEALTLATNGVSNNADWQPALETFNGVGMVLVPAGCFQMGSTEDQLIEATYRCEKFMGAGRCTEDFLVEQPVHEVCFENPFWVDHLEVSNRAYGSMNQTNSNSPYPFDRSWGWPRENISWAEANAFCKARGARLLTEAEWEYAARGPDALIYSWGNEFDPAMVNWDSGSPYPTGEKEEWLSWVGAYDLAGGVAEWVSDWYGPYSAHSQLDPQGPNSGTLHIVRGGHWFSRSAYHWRTAARERLTLSYKSSTVGFRCAMDFSEHDQ